MLEQTASDFSAMFELQLDAFLDYLEAGKSGAAPVLHALNVLKVALLARNGAKGVAVV
ncbi:hypothetical protein D3C72_2470360 [compost metagenome]